jgi:hypothetical protein
VEVLDSSTGRVTDIVGTSSSDGFDLIVLVRNESPGMVIVGLGLLYIGSSSISAILLGLAEPIIGDSRSEGYT